MPGSSSSHSPDRPPRTPTGKRKSTGSSTPLQTISESQLSPPPPIPVKSNLRNNSTPDITLPQLVLQPPSSNWFESRETGASTETGRTAPPAYEWVPAPGPADNEYLDNGPVEGEKLAALRGAGGFRRRNQLSWLRIGIAIAVLCAIALAVGLGVGLTSGGHKSNNSSGSSGSGTSPGSGNSTADLPFPLGDYSIVTALRTVDTGCTFNAATWTCFPYSTYDSSDSTSGMTVFSWTITNTSSIYATNTTGTTPDAGIPANLTISSTENPFGITFGATNVTYIASSNSSSPRYVFSLIQSKGVFPTAITADNSQAECFFNQTTFSGTLYLSAARTYPSSTNPDTKDANQWPYAVEVAQTSPGGSDTPACYEYTNGAVGARITKFTTPFTAETSQCTCDYRNY